MESDNRRWSGFAIAGFILSFFGIFAILGLVFSAIGLSHTANNRRKGRGLAIAGLIISILVLLFSVIFLIGIFAVSSILGFLSSGNISQEVVNGQNQVTISGISYNTNLNNTGQISVVINGINNNVTARDANVIRARLSGVNNMLYICSGQNPSVEKQGINNEVFSISC